LQDPVQHVRTVFKLFFPVRMAQDCRNVRSARWKFPPHKGYSLHSARCRNTVSPAREFWWLPGRNQCGCECLRSLNPMGNSNSMSAGCIGVMGQFFMVVETVFDSGMPSDKCHIILSSSKTHTRSAPLPLRKTAFHLFRIPSS